MDFRHCMFLFLIGAVSLTHADENPLPADVAADIAEQLGNAASGAMEVIKDPQNYEEQGNAESAAIASSANVKDQGSIWWYTGAVRWSRSIAKDRGDKQSAFAFFSLSGHVFDK